MPIAPASPLPTPSTPLAHADTRATAYTVTFDTDGGTPATPTQQVTQGKTATRPATDPTRDGYQFDGWFTGTTPVAYDFTRPVTQNTTITAHWTKGDGQWTINPDHGPKAGGTTVTLTPPPARGIRFSQTSTGEYHSETMGSDGNLYAWGDNQYGQLGDGTTTSQSTPVQVEKPRGAPEDFTWKQASSSFRHSGAIGSDGNLYTWGRNNYGQLGDGTDNNRTRPVKINKPTGAPDGFTWKQISMGSDHSAAIGSDGNLYTWGRNEYGQLGNGMTTSQCWYRPLLIDKPQGAPDGFTWKQISMGSDHSAAIGSDGNLYTWGWEDAGRLGRSTSITPHDRPGLVDKPTGATDAFAWKQISMGGHSAAIGSNGSLYTWGYNAYGQLGDGTTTDQARPVKIDKPQGAPNGFTWKQVSLGRWYSAALGSDGSLYTWGNNAYGQLGDGTKADKHTPTPVQKPQGAPDGFTWKQTSLGYSSSGSHSAAIGSDGNLYAWGGNSNGQLGDGTTTNRNRPVMVGFPGTATPTDVRFGQVRTVGITPNPDGTWQVSTPAHEPGEVDVTVVWNRNGPQPDAHLQYTYIAPEYQVGFTSKDSSCPAPTGMPPSQAVTQGGQAERPRPDPKADGCLFDGWFTGDTPVAYDFTRPVTQSITITAHWTKGDGRWTISPDHGPDTGGTTVTLTPPPARGIRFSQTSESDDHSLGIDSKGDLYTWGWNLYGQLGRDTGGSSMNDRPGRVTPPTGITFTQAIAGKDTSVAIGSDGNLYTWGYAGNSTLGRDTTGTPANRPGRVTSPDGVTFTQISAGAYYCMALGSDRNLYTWGWNGDGQLGRDTGSSREDNRPGRVTPPDGVTFTQASAGVDHSMAFGSDGNLYTWGDNSNGELGRDVTTGTPANRPGRVTPPDGTTFTQASAGAHHSMAFGSDGNLYTWGRSSNGELGRDVTTGTPANRPGRVTPPTGVTFTQASAGWLYSMGIGSDGNLYTWGDNSYGELGRDTTGTPANRPGRVTPPTGVTFTQISAGTILFMAFGSDGNLYTWGRDYYGQLGRDGANDRPGRVVFPSRGIPTRVLFDRLQSTVPMAGADDTWTVTTPAHTAGGVPVTISWTLDGTPQADDTGNTYRYVTIGSLPLTGSHGILLLAAIGLTLMAATDAARRHRHPTHTSHE